jgi:hypothetical protein
MGSRSACEMGNVAKEATNIVAVWVLDECERVVRDLSDELNPLRVRRVIDTPLQDTASMTVGGHLHAVSSDSIINELQSRRLSHRQTT